MVQPQGDSPDSTLARSRQCASSDRTERETRVLVPVGGEHLVVFGGPEPLPDSAAILVAAAAHAVADVQQVSPAKLLADELEVVHAIRDLMQYRADRVADTGAAVS